MSCQVVPRSSYSMCTADALEQEEVRLDELEDQNLQLVEENSNLIDKVRRLRSSITAVASPRGATCAHCAQTTQLVFPNSRVLLGSQQIIIP